LILAKFEDCPGIPAGALLDCLTPLQRLATAGMSVLLPHHPRRIGDLDSVAHASGFYFGMDCIAHTNFAHALTVAVNPSAGR
jgi:hypothetical protein